VPRLLARAEVEQVVVVDNLSPGRLESVSYLFPQAGDRLQFLRTDLRRQANVDEVFERFGTPDAVVHLAAVVDAAATLDNEGKRILCEEVNDHATVALARRAVELGVRTFVANSSTSVYGHGGSAVLTEESPCHPVTPYGRTKLASERILDLQSAATDVIVFRPATVFGWAPGYRYEVAVNLLALYAHVGVPLTIHRTNMHKNRPYLSIEDCVRVLEMAIAEPAKLAGQLWNAVSFNLSLSDILAVIFRIYPSASYQYTEAELVNQINFTVSGEKLYAAGFTPQADLYEALMQVRSQLELTEARHAGWLNAKNIDPSVVLGARCQSKDPGRSWTNPVRSMPRPAALSRWSNETPG
jgi:UDP-glucose 4-epimerase